MADELSDLELRERRGRGMELTLADLYARYRAHSQRGRTGLILYGVLTLLLIIYCWAWLGYDFLGVWEGWDYNFAHRNRGQIPEDDAILIAILHVAIMLWISRRLFESRQREYSLLRAIRRAQNYFRLNDRDFRIFPATEWNSYLPLRFGPDDEIRSVDDTAGWRWYRRRHVWLIGWNLAFIYYLFECTSSRHTTIPIICALVVHYIAIAIWFNRDRAAMTRYLMEERGLVGANEHDYPPREINHPQ